MTRPLLIAKQTAELGGSQLGLMDLLPAVVRGFSHLVGDSLCGTPYGTVLNNWELPGRFGRWEITAPAARVRLTCGASRDAFRRAAAALGGLRVLGVPSRREAFARVIMEAFAAGVPVAAAARGGIPEIVRHEQNGLLIPTGDTKALSDGRAALAG